MANKKVLYQYLIWAVGDLSQNIPGVVDPARPKTLRAGLSGAFLEQFEKILWPALATYLEDDASTILSRAEAFFNEICEPEVAPSSEMFDYHRMLAAMISTLLGEQTGLAWLGALLITQPLNRKLTISHFLGNLTEDKIGTAKKAIPSKEQVLHWVSEIKNERVPLTPLLREVISSGNS